MDELSITTDRLLITEFSEDMAESVHRNSLDDDNRRFVPDEVFPTVEAAQEVIRFLISCYRGTDGPFVYPVLLKSGENIGYVQAVCLGEAWEIGYHIGYLHKPRLCHGSGKGLSDGDHAPGWALTRFGAYVEAAILHPGGLWRNADLSSYSPEEGITRRRARSLQICLSPCRGGGTSWPGRT